MKHSSQLQLLDMPNNTSKKESSSTSHSVAKNWQQSFAGIFFYKYQEVTGEKCKLGFAALKKMLNQHAEKNWTDEETGEIEVPTLEQWTDEVHAFFQDSFAGKERGFHFSYLLKQFGSFKKFEPAQRKPSDPEIVYSCPTCSRVVKMKRSQWERYKNKQGTCSECGTKFNVNDVIKSVPSLNNYLGEQQ